MIIKKVFIGVLSLILLTGCTSLESDIELDLETDNNLDLDNNVDKDDNFDEEIHPDIEVESNDYYDLLLSYVFIDVLDVNKVDLPSEIMNEKILWTSNNKEVKSLSASNQTYYLTASIAKKTKNFNVTFKDNKVTEIYQQDLRFFYNFITDSKKFGTTMNPTNIVIHNTANTAAALNEVLYLNSSSNTSTTSFHFAVDDIGIYQAVPTNIYAHHAGNFIINKNSIGIEIAKSLLTDNAVKNKAIFNSMKLIRLLQMQYNIQNLMTHKDVTGKHCPHDILDRYGIDNYYNELQQLYYI